MEQTSGVGTTLFDLHFTDAMTGYVVGDVGVILKTTDGGSTWISQASGTTEKLTEVRFVDGVGYITKEVSGGDLEGILKTANGGVLWEKIDIGEFANLYALCFNSAGLGYAAGSGSVIGNTPIFKTLNGGTDWLSQDSKTTAIIHSLFFPSTDIGYASGAFSYSAKIQMVVRSGL